MGSFSTIIRTLLIFSLGMLVTTYAFTPNGSTNGRSRSAFKNEYAYSGLSKANGANYHQDQLTGSKQPGPKAQKSGIGLSAWGIVAVLSGALFLGTVLYYAVLFYPILCKKERKSQSVSMNNCCPTAPPDENVSGLSTPV